MIQRNGDGAAPVAVGMRRHRLPLLLLPLLLLPLVAGAVTACGLDDTITDDWYVGIGAKDRYEPDEVVLRIDVYGGLVPVEMHATALPPVTVYGDGRVVYLGSQRQPHGSSALPNVLIRTISEDAVADLVIRALRAGVGYRPHYENPGLMDAPMTKFTLVTTAGTMTTTVYGLGIDDRRPADERRARERLGELQDQLTDLPSVLGDEAGQERPYEPHAVAAVNTPSTGDPDPAKPEVAWPGPALPGEAMRSFGGLSCLTLTGPDIAPVLDAAQEAALYSPWTSGDARYHVWLRPLLPEEATCDDL